MIPVIPKVKCFIEIVSCISFSSNYVRNGFLKPFDKVVGPTDP